ncbi:hypothetical protein NDU88_006055 [Pleurodeles waltl]|uniref:Uncharacterized protein n=1 Tax=Pleurodeles waltl TaxID=8319 RepID=A0AAV7MY37_PLEWA|nr:hypothetical protein NDU88_006055 [Pleurodeles waltl]
MGRNRRKVLERTLKFCQDRLLDVVGPLARTIAMSQEAYIKGLPLDLELLRGWSQQAMVLLGNANAGFNAERHKAVLLKINPKLEDLAEKGWPLPQRFHFITYRSRGGYGRGHRTGAQSNFYTRKGRFQRSRGGRGHGQAPRLQGDLASCQAFREKLQSSSKSLGLLELDTDTKESGTSRISNVKALEVSNRIYDPFGVIFDIIKSTQTMSDTIFYPPCKKVYVDECMKEYDSHTI